MLNPSNYDVSPRSALLSHAHARARLFGMHFAYVSPHRAAVRALCLRSAPNCAPPHPPSANTLLDVFGPWLLEAAALADPRSALALTTTTSPPLRRAVPRPTRSTGRATRRAQC